MPFIHASTLARIVLALGVSLLLLAGPGQLPGASIAAGAPLRQDARPGAVDTGEDELEGAGEFVAPRIARSVGYTDLTLAPAAPNILVLLSDDQSFRLFERDLMPEVFARLVDRGVSFTRAYANQPQCCPSRASILTGLYAHRTGVDDNSVPLSRAERARPTFVQALHDLGYRTMLAGKYLNSETCDPHPGWDRWVCGTDDHLNQRDPSFSVDGGPRTEHTGVQPDLLADHAVDFIRQQTGEQPWLLFYAPRTPHLPGDSADSHSGPRLYNAPSFNVIGDPASRPSYARESMPRREERRMREDFADMGKMVPKLDAAIGRILDEVDARFPDTLVVYMSDNGWLYGEHGLRGKNVPYEEAVRVPLVVRYPPLVPPDQPRASDALVSNVDMAPTIMALAGVPWAADGRSWLPLLRGETDGIRDAVLIERCKADARSCADDDGNVEAPWWGLVTRQFAYVAYEGNGELELYDLDADPYQLNNQLMPVADPAARDAWAERLAAVLAERAGPTATIALGPGDTRAGTASFEVFAPDLAAELACQLEGPGQPGDWAPCPTGRVSYQDLLPGTYRFRARAADATGLPGAEPAARTFLVGGDATRP